LADLDFFPSQFGWTPRQGKGKGTCQKQKFPSNLRNIGWIKLLGESKENYCDEGKMAIIAIKGG
jgi:hypothetical protein